jgi:hypothetical protein
VDAAPVVVNPYKCFALKYSIVNRTELVFIEVTLKSVNCYYAYGASNIFTILIFIE